MQTNILEYLEAAALAFPEKTAYADNETALSFSRVRSMSGSVGTQIIKRLNGKKGPVPVFMKKSPMCLAAFFAVLYSGNPYVPVDTAMPAARVALIRDNLGCAAVLTDREHLQQARDCFGDDTEYIVFEEGADTAEDEALLGAVRDTHLDTDPAYILYTSGSTGIPKGVVVSHRSLIDYMDCFCPAVGVKDTDVIASQAPFYFDASLIDIYCTLKMGGTLHIVPIELFSQPLRLMEFLEEKKVTMIRWVPSAMGIVSMFKALDSLRPGSLRLIIFGAEVMPMKCFNYWYEKYPEADFVQIYGPTEITGICTYHFVKGDVSQETILPIGRPLKNCSVFLLDEEDALISPDDPGEGRTGEICVKGSCLAHGYYNDPERTAAVFVQNPLNGAYPERIYRTGDLARYNSKGELVFVSRKDFQIKHMGHRIELGEIEAAAAQVEGTIAAACFFDGKKNKIHMAYVSESLGEADMLSVLSERLPRYMIPTVLHRVESIPHTATGKADRVALSDMYI